MKRYTIQTAKRISNDTERTLQSTYESRDKLAEKLQHATELKAEYDRLVETLTELRNSNEKLAAETDESIQEQIKRTQELSRATEDLIEEEREEDRQIDAALEKIDRKLKSLRIKGDTEYQFIEDQLKLYAQFLGLDISTSTKGYEVRYTDLKEVVFLTFEDPTTVLLNGVQEPPIKFDTRDPLSLGKALYKARSLLAQKS